MKTQFFWMITGCKGGEVTDGPGNRATRATKVEAAAYDDERFWAYRVGGTASIWTLRDIGGRVVRQYNSHAGWTNHRDCVHRGSTLFATADSTSAGGAIRHLHPDRLGTPRLITDSSGNPATATFHTYYPFGDGANYTIVSVGRDGHRGACCIK